MLTIILPSPPLFYNNSQQDETTTPSITINRIMAHPFISKDHKDISNSKPMETLTSDNNLILDPKLKPIIHLSKGTTTNPMGSTLRIPLLRTFTDLQDTLWAQEDL